MARQITMRDGARVARQAAADVEAWLRAHNETVSVRNVEGNPAYQRADVDLVWTTAAQREIKIEIKGDRWHKTGNFFFETHSNQEKGTPGCFLYSQADFLFYYFVIPRVLYILPLPATREWFLANLCRFPERAARTPVGDDYYTTVGRLAPIIQVMREVRGVKRREL